MPILTESQGIASTTTFMSMFANTIPTKKIRNYVVVQTPAIGRCTNSNHLHGITILTKLM